MFYDCCCTLTRSAIVTKLLKKEKLSRPGIQTESTPAPSDNQRDHDLQQDDEATLAAESTIDQVMDTIKDIPETLPADDTVNEKCDEIISVQQVQGVIYDPQEVVTADEEPATTVEEPKENVQETNEQTASAAMDQTDKDTSKGGSIGMEEIKEIVKDPKKVMEHKDAIQTTVSEAIETIQKKGDNDESNSKPIGRILTISFNLSNPA